ncbi:uncharacterized protein LOC751678 [Danio rerio]|uniref:Uncharacterized protein LOC751678 n=1 Tax=Danio rerio TaxID=7955 RepID=Q0P4E3_DANRE|nr:uncharacterized protein LOC751678 [Danio rerio]AAI22125.1 Zgc:153044 [Danio rerio]|eukprot:NP_001038858.1 uncharacterized protein LOC751678 [Danio rerio]
MSSGSSSSLGGFAQVTDHLFIGTSKTASDSRILQSLHITCIINSTQNTHSSDTHLPSAHYMQIPVPDDPSCRLSEYFHSVSDKIQQVSEERGRVLLHCNAGVSRSASLCLAFLIKHHRLTLREAHQMLKAKRPIIRPNNGFWSQLVEFELSIHGRNTVRMIDSPVGIIPDLYERETRGLIPL